jgi:ketosteroid isomerase-like protein
VTSENRDRAEVLDVVNRYAEACDRRDWGLFDRVFTADATADYGGEFELAGREAIAGMVRSMLGGCGPTQHLLGNHTVEVEGDTARASCKVRAFHAGIGDHDGSTYEVLGEYHHDLVRTAAGWLTAHLRMDIAVELGTRDVLQPAP